MAKLERYPSRRHKLVKRQIAAGQYKQAERELESERDSLISMLKFLKCDREEIELRLTRNSSLLAECNSKWGKPQKAEKWFTKALKHCERLKDPMVRERILRVRGMHYAGLGRFYEAEADLRGVIATLESESFDFLPRERVQLEIAFTTSRLAESMLLRDQHNRDASDLLLAMRPLIRAGNKPRYELENLMALIAVTPWTSPVLQRRIIMRAFQLNTLTVRNSDYFVRIADAGTVVPITSVVQKGLMRVGF